MARVAIVGAGVAGLRCAQGLREQGIEARVFEKSRGLGGRLARRQYPWGSVDIGAPLLTVNTPPADWSPLVAQGQVIRQRFRCARWQLSGFEALPDQQHYIATPSNNQLCHYLADGVEIQRNCRVGRIQQGRLFDEQGQALGEFDAVILTAPAPQSRALLPEDSPLLPDDEPWQPGWTLLLQFETALALADIIEFADHPLFSRLVHLSALEGRSHRGCYSLQLSAAASAWLRKTGDEQGLAQCLSALAEIVEVPPLLHWGRQGWQLLDGKTMQLRDDRRVDHRQRIVLAGDWCAGGGVEGAWRSAALALAQVAQWQAGRH